MLTHIKSIGGTDRELTFEAVDKNLIAVGYIAEKDKPAIYLHVNASALKMAVQLTEQEARQIK